MTREELEELYKNKILPESRNPYHFEKKEKPGEEILAYNPMCGDKYQLYLDQEGNEINEMHFHGIGCAISKASTSILLKKMEGRSYSEASKLITPFLDGLTSPEANSLGDEELDILLELRNFDGRVDCIKLSWESMLNELKKE